MSLVSIIIPVYNRVTYLDQAIASVLRQTHVDTQIIVVDDGSLTDVRSAVVKYGDRVALYRKENGGPAAARNYGLARASGEWVLFLDDDDFLEPQAIHKLLAAAHREGMQWAAGRYVYVDEQGRRLNRSHRCRYQSGDIYRQMIHNNLMGAPSVVLARVRAVYAVGQFDEDRAMQICEDYDLWFSLARDNPIAVTDDIVTNYRVHNNQATTNWARLFTTRLRVLEKHRLIARPGHEHDFDQAVARMHLEFGDEFYVRGMCREARREWSQSLKAECGIGKASMSLRFTKSCLPEGVLKSCRRVATAWRGSISRVRIASSVSE